MKAFNLEKDTRVIYADELFRLHNAINMVIGKTALSIADGTERDIDEAVRRVARVIITETEDAVERLIK